MLTRLHVKNYALVDDLILDFDPKMNVLTGETGAGKSLLIGALRFVMGGRVEALKTSLAQKTVSVEAIFEGLSKTLIQDALFSQFIDEDDEQIILRRDLTAEGKTKLWINHHTANLSMVRRLSEHLIDIHGQYDHQVLLNPLKHLEFVDNFGNLSKLKQKYKMVFDKYNILRKRQKELREMESVRERELDLLKYQIDEIEKAGLTAEEENDLQLERIRLANVEKLHEMSARALALLDDDNRSVSELMSSASREINSLANLDESLNDVKNTFEDVQFSCEEIIRKVRDYFDELSFDPDRLHEIEERLEVIELLKRKYGQSVQEIVAFLEKSKERFEILENSELHEKEIGKKIVQLKPEIDAAADELTKQRTKASQKLHQRVAEELKDLRIGNARFECEIKHCDYRSDGRDELIFKISLNPGQPLQELKSIISAGEVSRVMLAMKKVLMDVDPIPTLIFDEIDANIGGRLGTVTGKKLKEIATKHQVLLITHLPQIASFADRHFYVAKKIRNGKTSTEYSVIDGADRVRELAQMMSGRTETDISKKHAAEMLSKGR